MRVSDCVWLYVARERVSVVSVCLQMYACVSGPPPRTPPHRPPIPFSAGPLIHSHPVFPKAPPTFPLGLVFPQGQLTTHKPHPISSSPPSPALLVYFLVSLPRPHPCLRHFLHSTEFPLFSPLPTSTGPSPHLLRPQSTSTSYRSSPPHSSAQAFILLSSHLLI